MEETTLNGQSDDIVSENIKKLKQIFPEVFYEDSIDFEKLQAVLGKYTDDNEERYNFTWWGKSRALRLAQSPSVGTLRPCKEESKDWDTTQNLYIEGDNLEVLKLLQKTYHNKIKMIYIDPPYNTGNDFVYPDDYRNPIRNYFELTGQVNKEGRKLGTNNEANGRYHTNWLNMMYPRLKLARNLLRDDGVIFISIDDNEVHNLRKLCDEIFGESSFVSQVIWKSKYGAGAKTKGFIDVHEYILCYSKRPIENIDSPISEEDKKAYDKKDEKYKIRGGYFTQPLMTTSLDDRPNLQYSIFYNGIEIKPRKQWVWSKERLEEAIKNNEVVFSEKKDGSFSVRSKQYLIDEFGVERKGKPLSIQIGPYTQEGTSDITDLFGLNIFGFIKPVSLLEYLFSFTVNDFFDDKAIILDFFSGSGTSAHAVFRKNIKMNSNNRFIMVQLPEKTDEQSEAYKAGYKNICEIGKERIRRAGKKIKAELEANQKKEEKTLFDNDKPEKISQKLDIGFRVYKLDSSNMQDVYYRPQDYKQNMLDLFADNVKPGRTAIDLVTQVMLDWGLPLSLKIKETQIADKQVYKVAGNSLLACFDFGIDENFAKVIANEKPLRIVFRDRSFASDTAKENVRQLFKQLSPETEMRVI